MAAALALLVGVAALAQQADRARTEALARRATERLEALQREADRLASDERTLLGDLRKLEVEREIKTHQLGLIETEEGATRTELAAIGERLHQVERRKAADRPALRARFVELYKLGQGRYLRLLLSTSDLRHLGQASRAVAALAQIDRDRFAAYQRTIAELTSLGTHLEDRGRQLQAMRGDAARAAQAAARAAQARSDLIREIDRRRDLNAQLAGELQAAQQKLQAALRALASGAPVADPVALPLGPFRGDLDWPASGSVRRRFGAARGASATSNGIEIATAEGAPARVVHDGVVAFADAFTGFGRLVIVDHGSRAFSLYGNLLDIAVARGARVERGQALGTVGATPTGSAALYFELRVDDQPVDPVQWLKKR